MGVVRDRVASGLKAAATNQSKDRNHYKKIAPIGGKSVDATKRAFAAIKGLAQRAARIKHDIKDEHYIQHIVTAEGLTASIWNSRDAARAQKRLLRVDKNIKAKIFRVEYYGDPYKGGFILSRKEVS